VTPVRLGTTFECTQSWCPAPMRGTGAPPKSGKCRACKMPLLVRRGLFGVFQWREDGHYPLAHAGAAFHHAGAAEKFVAARPYAFELVVRFVVVPEVVS
jgi:hypothetical protein